MKPILNRKLELDTVYRTRDNAGGYTETWSNLGTMWGAVKPGTGRETELSGLTLSSVPCKITVRAAPQGAPSRPVAGQRFREGERIFQILAVSEADPEGRFLNCFAEEKEVTR